MNRIVIKLDENGDLDTVVSDLPCRIFVLDETCIKEPVYELNHDTGVHYVTKLLANKLAATGDSIGPWKKTSPLLEEVK